MIKTREKKNLYGFSHSLCFPCLLDLLLKIFQIAQILVQFFKEPFFKKLSLALKKEKEESHFVKPKQRFVKKV